MAPRSLDGPATTGHTETINIRFAYWRDGVLRSEPFESDRQDSGKTVRSEALRGGLIEGHTRRGMNPNADR
jgi:hypothetical protein